MTVLFGSTSDNERVHWRQESAESPGKAVVVHRKNGNKRIREEDLCLEDGNYVFPILAVYEAPLLLSGPAVRPIFGPLAFNPVKETQKCLLASPSLLQPCFPLQSLSFPRFLMASSLQPSICTSVAADLGPQLHGRSEAASAFSHNHLELLRCPGTNDSIVFFPTGENSERVGYVILSVQDSSLVARDGEDRGVCLAGANLNHQILRISVNPVVESCDGSSPAAIGYLLAYTMYSVHWYHVLAQKGGTFPKLIHVGTRVFKSCSIVHACWNPYLREQSIVLLESGEMFLFDLEKRRQTNKVDQYCKGNKLRVLWDHPSSYGDFRWLACEFSWNFKTLVVARSDAVFSVSLEHGQCDVRCLMKIEDLNLYASTEKEEFHAMAKATSDGFYFALVSDSVLVLCDVCKLSRPVLQWWTHGLEKPRHINVLRLCDLRSNLRDNMYKKASESGLCIILGSFWTSHFNLFCYGPSVAETEVSRSLYAWENPSSLILSGRDCLCGNCLVKEEFRKDDLPAWIDWQYKKELVLGFSILDKDLSEMLSEPDEFGGFTLVRLMSSGKLESQRYSASWDPVEKIEEAHEKVSVFEDYLVCYALDEEYKFPRRFKYLQFDYLKAYMDHNLDKVLISKLNDASSYPLAKNSLTLKYHEILCEKLKICGLARERTSSVIDIVFRDVSLPSNVHEVSLKRIWADVPVDLLQMAFSCYSELLEVRVDAKLVSSEFLAVPDQPQLPPFVFRNPSVRSNKWSQKVPSTESLVGPVIPLPVLMTLHSLSSNGSSSLEEKLRQGRAETMAAALELAALDPASELRNSRAISLAEDKEENWPDSERVKPYLLHQPSAFSDTETLSGYEDEALGTLVSKTRDSIGILEHSAGLQMFDSLCPVELRFENSSGMDFGARESKAYKLLKKQFSQWQGRLDLYQEFCSKCRI